MTQSNVTTSGSYSAETPVSATGEAANEMLADIAQAAETLSNIAQAAISVASTDAPGRVELATTEETAAGTDTTRAVTPAGLAAQHYIKSKDVTYKALNDNGCVGSDASQVARGDHGHPNASSAAAGFISAADKFKLDGIEAEATADQTGAEIVAAIDTELGGSHWQQGGEGIDEPHIHSAADLPDRGAFYGKALGASLAENGGMVDINVPGLPAKAAAGAADLVPIWDAEAAAHRHVRVAGLPADRGIVAPSGEDPAISMELPSAVDRRDFLLGFTATGAVTTTKVATARDVDDLAARGMTTVENIAELCAARPRRAGGAVHVRGYHRAGDGGGGTFMWDAASTKTPDGGTVFAAESDGIGRWIKLYDQLVNIKSFGAKGDGKADDTAAVQAAVDSGLPLFVPPGTYKLSAAITWTDKLTMISPSLSTFLDNRAGNPEEALFHRAGRYMKADGTWHNTIVGHPAVTLTGPVILKNICFYAKQSAVEIQGARQSFVEQCEFRSNFRGLTFAQSTFDSTVINCRFSGTYFRHYGYNDPTHARLSWGLYINGHAFVYASSGVGWGAAIHVTGTGNVISGVRNEVNTYGILLANKQYNVTGIATASTTRSSITGISLEANQFGMLIENASACNISGVGIQGSPTDGSRPDSEAGILINCLGSGVRVDCIDCGGHFTRGAVINFSSQPLWFDTGYSHALSGTDYGAVNSPLNGTGVDPRPGYHFLKTKMFPTARRNTSLTAFSDLMHIGLTGLNIQNPSNGGPIFSKNLGDVAIPDNGAFSKTVRFCAKLGSSIYAINKIILQDDLTSVLAEGPCYYATTIVSRHSETGINYYIPDIHNYRTVVGGVGPGQRVYLTFHGGTPNGTVRRLYRGRAVGVFDGYWDIEGSSFTDDGKVAFTATGMPPKAGDSPSRIEDDANYQIVATPSWATTVHVTDKATTGFTLNFSTAAPDGNQTVSWLMFRP